MDKEDINFKLRLPNTKKFLSLGLCFWVLFGSWSLQLGASNIDSLKARLQQHLHDTDKVGTLNTLAWELKYINPDTSCLLLKQALKIADKITLGKGQGWPKGKSATLRNIGVMHTIKSNYAQALKSYFHALQIDETHKDKKGIAPTLGNIGIVYQYEGNYPKALEYYFRALKIDEELENKRGVTRWLGNIGSVYWYQGNHSKALDYYFRALKIDKELADLTNIAGSYGNIGLIYYEEGDYDKALEYYFKALEMNEESGNKSYLAINLGNIGNLYDQLGNLAAGKDSSSTLKAIALDYYFRAVKTHEEIGDKSGMSSWLGNIGSMYRENGKFKDAEQYLLHAVSLSTGIGSLDLQKDHHKALADLYANMANYELAYEHYKLHTAAKDSIFNEEKSKDIGRLEAQHEFDKQQAIAQAEHEKELQLAAEREKRQQVMSYSAAGGLLLVLVFALFIWNRYKLTQSQKAIIEEQKKVVEEKQEEIYASMRYAKRIQDALLPKEKYIHKELRRLMKKN